MPLNRPVIVVVLLALVALFALGRGGDERQEVRRSRILLGTVVEITALGSDPDRLESAVSDAFAEMGRIENLMSPHIAESDVARLSRADQPLEVSPETAEVLEFGREIARKSGGVFDLSLGRLKALWGIEGEAPRVPQPEEIRAALAGIGPDALTLVGRRVVKGRPELAVDLGGIAKGYALDRAAAVLAAAGIVRASVNAGGDLRLLGDHGERPWRIGIQHPRDPLELLATLEVADRAVVTSGDYERYFERDGRRYHHLFDPRSGYPAAACQSVTVVADSAMLADALATAVFVLGPERGLVFLAGFPGTEALIVDRAGQLHQSPGMGEYRP